MFQGTVDLDMSNVKVISEVSDWLSVGSNRNEWIHEQMYILNVYYFNQIGNSKCLFETLGSSETPVLS